jgi:hypothetical protein
VNTGKTHFKKGMIPWNKGKKFSKESRLKMSIAHIGKPSWNSGKIMDEKWCKRLSIRNSKLVGENALNWKGDFAGYHAMHRWVQMLNGKPNYCEHCKRKDKKRYEWANKDHKYQRIITDYMRLCTSCHRLYDIINNNYKNL